MFTIFSKYTIPSIGCIVILAGIIIGYFIAFCRKTPFQKIEFVRKFKKGNCAVVYLVAIPLYIFGYLHGGKDCLTAIFSSISKTATLVVLRYDTTDIQKLMGLDPVYKFAVYFCFTVVAINAALFVFSLIYQRVGENWRKMRWFISPKEKLLLVGMNSENLAIYQSEKNRKVLLLDDIPDKEKNSLFAKKITYISRHADVESKKRRKNDFESRNEIEDFCFKLLKETVSRSKRSCVIIINTQDDATNIALCHKIIAYTDSLFKNKDAKAVAQMLTRVRVYVFGKPDHETIYDGIVESSNGCIHYVNKYRQIAIDFINRYPLTQFMTKKQLDYKTSLLRHGVDINVVMIGFGKTNQQIFLTSAANNQFMTETNGKIVLKPVNYHIFDKRNADSNKNLNHSYRRFQNEFENEIKNQQDGGKDQPYLPFPVLSSSITPPHVLDVNDPAFYKEVRNALSGRNSFNYIVIAFGTDLENLDMAQKLLVKKQEWGLRNTYVFVKVRSGNDSHKIFQRDDCFLIGDEKQVVYHIDRIADDAITNMAMMRNRIYTLEYEITSRPNKMLVEPVELVYARADCDWYIKKTQTERESNLYACLSLRSKLHMMGLDYIQADATKPNKPLSEDQYMKHYAGDDRPILSEDLADGKAIIEYGINFKESRRKTMAIYEHYRWNSFMFSKGFVPASKAEILADTKRNGKDYALRRHGNLTTFEGLLEFRKLVAQRDAIPDESETDVIKYDYQILDDAYWLLTRNNFQIVNRGK